MEMAQFYQVLNQDETTKLSNNDDLTQYYSTNINETITTTTTAAAIATPPTVQYVITPDQQQQFQTATQQVVVSSDQLMVVDGQTAQSVILDQSAVTYPTSSYIIQESNTIDFQNNHQIYYMTNTPTRNQIVVEQPPPQSVVLNQHIIDNNQTTTTTTGVLNKTSGLIQNCSGNNQIIAATTTTPIQQLRGQKILQLQQQQQQTGVSVNHNQQKVVSAESSTQDDCNNKQLNHSDPLQKRTTAVLQNMPKRPMSNMNRQDATELTEYKKMLLQRRNTERLSNPMNQVARKIRTPPAKLTLPLQQATPPPPPPPPPPPSVLSQQQQQQQQHIQTKNRSVKTQNQDQYIIQPPKYQQNRPQRPLPAFLQSSQILSVIENMSSHEKYSDSIRMLVLLDNGEQRLITFTLPKESCTIHEILEQVGVSFQHDTPIKLIEVNVNGLNYVVTVGNVPGFDQYEQLQQQQQQQQADEILQQQNNEISSSLSPIATTTSITTKTTTTTATTSPPTQEPNLDSPLKCLSPEPSKDMIPPKILPGKLALCSYCGYLSEDFNKCMRCKRRLPDNVKTITSPNNAGKKIDPRSLDKRLILPKPNGTPKLNLLQKKRPTTRPKLLECETVVVSSDEEEDDTDTSPVKNMNEQLLVKLGTSVTIRPISKEPSIRDILKCSSMVAAKGFEKIVPDKTLSTVLTCRTIRIGSYKYIPPEPIKIDSTGFILQIPHPKLDPIIKVIKIESYDIVKVLVSFQKLLPVIFYYLLPSVGDIIRNALDMTVDSEYYFDPLSENDESHRRITLLPELISEDSKEALVKIYSRSNSNIFDELTYKEANDILMKTCPKDVSRTISNFSSSTMSSDIKQLLMYPQEGRGRISINTEDYMCLGTDQFLNDVIIDFYLKYLEQNLPKQQQEKVHIFSTFFYKRLTTKPVKATKKSQPSELDPNLTPAQKRHARVKTWTKNVNLFEKDYIIIPINENCHWFLAIICFPGMDGTHTMDGQPIKIEQNTKNKKAATTTRINLPKEKLETAIMCEEGDLSDKDEAEGDDSELESDDSEESLPTPPPPPPPSITTVENSKRPPIKQPCILIFDSLAGASRSRVVATLRDYLTCEYKAKLNIDKTFTKDVIKGACPKVPQQTNFTDCGLYLLQYVEHFFRDPIKDYFIPIKHLKTWFDELIVTKKREDISLLIKSLMKAYNKDLSLLPEVAFPTHNGELVDRPSDIEDKFYDPDEFDQDDEEEDESIPKSQHEHQQQQQPISENDEKSVDSAKDKNDFIEHASMMANIAELPRQSNKETLSYLKAKRIVRHKNNQSDGPDAKKTKTVETSTSS